jgi:hypothetical protein
MFSFYKSQIMGNVLLSFKIPQDYKEMLSLANEVRNFMIKKLSDEKQTKRACNFFTDYIFYFYKIYLQKNADVYFQVSIYEDKVLVLCLAYLGRHDIEEHISVMKKINDLSYQDLKTESEKFFPKDRATLGGSWSLEKFYLFLTYSLPSHFIPNEENESNLEFVVVL